MRLTTMVDRETQLRSSLHTMTLSRGACSRLFLPCSCAESQVRFGGNLLQSYLDTLFLSRSPPLESLQPAQPFTPMGAPHESVNGYNRGYSLSAEDKIILQQAKQEHSETTEAAKRALKIAEETQDVARGTLVEVHRQGQQLDKAEAGFQQIDEDVQEASSLLKFMRRWCCVQLLCCCDCCDPDFKRDRTRKRRVEQRKADLEFQHANSEMQTIAKQEAVDRRSKRDDPAYAGGDTKHMQDATRSELFDNSARIRAIQDERRRPKATDIGFGLPEDDRREIQAHTDEQEEYLDRVGQAVSTLHYMSKDIHEELQSQDPKVQRLQERAEVSHDKLGNLAREARRI